MDKVMTIEQWCALCDALHCGPDVSAEHLIAKAKALQTALTEARKCIHQSQGEESE